MIYLFFQIWLWLILAFVLGWATNWFLCCRNKHDDIQASGVSASTIDVNTTIEPDVARVATQAPAAPKIDESWKPQGFASRPDKTDDLKRIKGVGLVIEQTLNELGIYQFSQIAEWNHDNVSWVEHFLAFPGRIGREDWITQSKTLSGGGTTDFAKRVDKGDVGYK